MYGICIAILALSILEIILFYLILYKSEFNSEYSGSEFVMCMTSALIISLSVIGICSNEKWEREEKIKTIEKYNNGEIIVDTIYQSPKYKFIEKEIIKQKL